MTVHRWILCSALLALCAVLSGNARAAEPDAAARDFKEGKRLYDSRQYQAALDKFQEAWERSHSPNARLYIGRCFNKLGNLRVAYDELSGTLRDASTRAASDPKYAETQNAAAA